MATAQIIKTAHFELTVKVAPDRLKLFVDAKPASPAVPVTRKDLLEALRQSTTEVLLEAGVLDDIAERLSKGEACSERRVAKGSAAVPGNNGRVAIMIKPFTGKGAPRENAQGILDFHSLHLFDNVESGAIVAKIFPPTTGKDGIDATGKSLTALSGKPAKVSVDKTLRLERPRGEELECLVASTYGYLYDDNGRLGIREELALPSDIDLRTGNVDFIGALVINGDIAPGFFARARRGVVVTGGIRDAILESTDGDIVVKGFAFGGPGAARVISGGAITLTSSQELLVEARADLIVEKHATDCILRTHNALLAPSAKIVGGDVFAVCGGEVGELGNDAGKRTVFHLCSSVEADPAYATLEARIATHTKAIGMIEGHLGPYAKNPARIQLLKAPFRGKMEELARKLDVLRKSLMELAQSKVKILASAARNESQRVNILKCAHAGSVIMCNGESLILKDSVNGPISIDFDSLTSKFIVGTLQALVCTVRKDRVASKQKGDKK